MDQVFEVRVSRPRLAGYLLLGASIIATSLLAVQLLGHTIVGRVIGWGVGAFFAPVTAFYLVEFCRGGIRARISRDGVDDRVIGVGLIPWSEIESVDFANTSLAGSIALRLRNEKEWTRKMTTMSRLWAEFNRLIGHPRFAVNLAGSGASGVHALLAAMEHKGDGSA